jgi:hypothetical protein
MNLLSTLIALIADLRTGNAPPSVLMDIAHPSSVIVIIERCDLSEAGSLINRKSRVCLTRICGSAVFSSLGCSLATQSGTRCEKTAQGFKQEIRPIIFGIHVYFLAIFIAKCLL